MPPEQPTGALGRASRNRSRGWLVVDATRQVNLARWVVSGRVAPAVRSDRTFSRFAAGVAPEAGDELAISQPWGRPAVDDAMAPVVPIAV